MRQSIFRQNLLWLGALTCAFLATAAHAADQRDLKIAMKTLGLLTDRLHNPVIMAVVFDPALPASKVEANAIVDLVGSGMEGPGGITVNAEAIVVSDLAKHTDIKIIAIPPGLSRSWDEVAAHAVGILSITTDLDCVKAEKCIIGIVSRPDVEIYFSRAAAEAQRIRFSEAFAMLAKKF